MNRIKRRLPVILVLYLLLELVARIFISTSFSSPFFKPGALFLHYYPELKAIREIPDRVENPRLLILGGSVVYEDTIPLEINGNELKETFCNLSHLLGQDTSGQLADLEVYSLAQPAHNSLDSRLKFEWMGNKHFDYVFFYHGINDTRTNNISREDFDPDYRHIEFYNDLHVIHRHPEINITTVPFLFDWLWQKIKIQTGMSNVIPREHFDDFDSPETQNYLAHGQDIKSAEPFRKNLLSIREQASEEGMQVLAGTYAHYLPANYSLEAFQARELDYVGQIFPAELYGIPKQVARGINKHNQVVRELTDAYSDLHRVEIADSLPAEGQYYDDICHLSDRGCERMTQVLAHSLKKLQAP